MGKGVDRKGKKKEKGEDSKGKNVGKEEDSKGKNVEKGDSKGKNVEKGLDYSKGKAKAKKFFTTLREVRTLDLVLAYELCPNEVVLLDIADDIEVHEYCNISLFVQKYSEEFEIIDENQKQQVMLKRAFENRVEKFGQDVEELTGKVAELEHVSERLKQKMERDRKEWEKGEPRRRRAQQQMEEVDRYLAMARLEEEGDVDVAERGEGS